MPAPREEHAPRREPDYCGCGYELATTPQECGHCVGCVECVCEAPPAGRPWPPADLETKEAT